MFLLVGTSFFDVFNELLCFLVAAPAREWTLTNHENPLVLSGESAWALLCAPRAKNNNDGANIEQSRDSK